MDHNRILTFKIKVTCFLQLFIKIVFIYKIISFVKLKRFLLMLNYYDYYKVLITNALNNNHSNFVV